MANYDLIGNVAIVKFDRNVKARKKKKWALDFLKRFKNVSTVLEKSDRFKGRLRTQKTKYLAGVKTKEALYRENRCVFRFNVDSCYFSQRLASERKEIASFVKKGENVLVMFGGIAPYAIVIAKLSKVGKVVSIELGKECNRYALENVKRNKLQDKIEIVQGGVRKIIMRGGEIDENAQESSILGATKPQTVPSYRKRKGFVGFDRIVMARPNLKDNFLDVAFSVVKKGGIIHYYGFYIEVDLAKMKEMIFDEASKNGRKIKILRIKKAGEIGVRRYRYRVDFRVL